MQLYRRRGEQVTIIQDHYNSMSILISNYAWRFKEEFTSLFSVITNKLLNTDVQLIDKHCEFDGAAQF